MPRRLVIDMNNSLPPRARPLTSGQLENVFGGCGSKARPCKQTRDCCAGVCYGYHAGYRMGVCTA
jgi:hypothetical protein